MSRFSSWIPADLRYALRSLRNSPAFAAIAIASLGLGIGLNTAIFNLVSAVLLQPMPLPESERLVSVFTLDPTYPGFLSCSYPNYKDYRDRNTVFEGLTIYSTVGATITSGAATDDLAGALVSGNYFAVLGIKPILGRTFLPEEDSAPGAHPVAVISYGFWTRRMASNPHAIGTQIGLNNYRYTIVGVAPKDFHGTDALVNTELWVPFMMYGRIYPMADWVNYRKALVFTVTGRLKRGVSRAQAEDQMKTLTAQLAREYPDDNHDRTVILVPLEKAAMPLDTRGAYVLAGGVAMGASALVLVIACANVGNLLLVRAAARRKGMALRLALGVSRWRLAILLMTESGVLAALGAVMALMLGRWTRDLLWRFRPPWMLSGGPGLRFDARVLALTVGLAVLATLIFGLAPLAHSWRTNLATELRERLIPWTNPGLRLNSRGMLVIAQVALSVVALSGAGLFLRSLNYVQHLDPGFETIRMATFSLDIKACGYSEPAAQAFYARMLERLRGVPGIAAATFSSNSPFVVPRARSISIEGQPNVVAPIDVVEAGYFQAVRIPLLHGRPLAAADNAAASRVAVINETLARRFWNGRNPVGARLRFFGDNTPVEIVGVAKDSTYMSLGESPSLMIYLPLAQNYSTGLTLWVRTYGDPSPMLGVVRREIQSLDTQVLVQSPQTMQKVIHEALWAPRLGALLFTGFGALAGVLTIIGIFGVISYSVGQRTREMGIRMAMGAQPGDVVRQVVAEGGILVLWGLVIGLAVTLIAGRVISNLLTGVSARDPLTLGAVIALLLIAALAACAAPALRATRIDPMRALRDE